MVEWNVLLVLELPLHHANGVRRLHLEGGDLVGDGLDGDLHAPLSALAAAPTSSGVDA